MMSSKRLIPLVFAIQAFCSLAAASKKNKIVRHGKVAEVVDADGSVHEVKFHEASEPAMQKQRAAESHEALEFRVNGMLEDVENMANAGVTPEKSKIKTIKDIVKDELIPDLMATRKAAADQVTVNLGSIDACNSNALSRLSTIKTSTESSVSDARSKHATCREAEKEKTSTKSNRCKELDDWLAGINDPQNLPSGRARKQMVEYVKAMSNYYCPKGPEVDKLDEACAIATKEHSEHKSTCDGLQRTFESGFCTWRTEINALVAKWKTEYAALKKIECYVDVWLSDNNENTVSKDQFEKCKGSNVDTSAMDIDFGTPADKAQCSLDAVKNYPGTDGFLSTEYEQFKEFTVQVVACLPLGSKATIQESTQNTATAVPEPATLPPEQSCSALNSDVQKSCTMPMWHDLINLEAETVSMMCTPKLVLTKGSSCEQWCAKHGYHCLRAQDNTENTCNLDDRHTRKNTADNGCNQNWNNQVCQCGKKA